MQTPVAWTLHDAYIVSPDEAYALGEQNTVLGFDGISWQQIAVPGGFVVLALWASEAACGSPATTRIPAG